MGRRRSRGEGEWKEQVLRRGIVGRTRSLGEGEWEYQVLWRGRVGGYFLDKKWMEEEMV